jgi:hypothetical protein
MATLVLRNETGSPLTFEEVDNNFQALNQDVEALDQGVSSLLSRTIWGQPLSTSITGPLSGVTEVIGDGPLVLRSSSAGESVIIGGLDGGHVILNPPLISGEEGTVQIRNGRFYRVDGDFFASINAEALTANRSLVLANGDTTLVPGTMVPTTGGGATGTWDISISGGITSAGSIRLEAGGEDNNIVLAPAGNGTVNAPTFNATSSGQGGFQGVGTDNAGTPSFTWTNDLDTGLFRPGAGRVGITADGLEVVRFDRLGGPGGSTRRVLAPAGLSIEADGALYLDSKANATIVPRLTSDTTAMLPNLYVNPETGRLQQSTATLGDRLDAIEARLTAIEAQL